MIRNTINVVQTREKKLKQLGTLSAENKLICAEVRYFFNESTRFTFIYKNEGNSSKTHLIF